MRFRPPPSAPGCRASRAARSARASAARAAFVRRRRIAIPATTSSWAALRRGREAARDRARRARARPRRGARSGAGAGPRDSAHARRSTRSPCASSVARAASSAFAGQPRSRETSAISASATTHRARATASFGPKARAALRSSAFARTRSPSCAIAMPRSASAGASSRKRDAVQRAERIARRERPRRGRDQRVHRNPATLVTPTVRCPVANLSHDHQPAVVSERTASTRTRRKTMTTHKTGTREEWLAARLELLEAEKELTRRSDELARQRQELPWVRIDKAYRFDTEEGSASLRGPLPGPLAAPRLSLHVRARLQGGLPVLLGDRRRLQRHRRAPGEPRRDALGGVAGAAREAAGVQAADGLDLSLGVVARQRLQLRLQRLVHRGAAARRAASNTTTGASRAMRVATGEAGGGSRSRSSRRCPAPTWPPTRATGRA